MLAALAKHDAAAFQDTLVHALTWHKKAYGTPAKRLLETGMVAWDLLAFCCLAHDQQLRFEAETDHLPQVLSRNSL